MASLRFSSIVSVFQILTSRSRSILAAMLLFCTILTTLSFCSFLSPTQALADEEQTPSTRIIYHFVESSQLEHETSFSDYASTIDSVCAGKRWVENGQLFLQANSYPDHIPTSNTPHTMRVLKNYASSTATSEGMTDLTEEASFDSKNGTISLPSNYENDDLTVVWYLSDETASSTVPLVVEVSKTLGGQVSHARIESDFRVDAQAIDLKLFDDVRQAELVQNIVVLQGGQEITQYVYQNGSISICASPLGGPIAITLSDGSGASTETSDSESAFNTEAPLISLFSAANPAIGERFALDADSAVVRTSVAGNNMAAVLGWPEKSGTYGFLVHINRCVNPEVINADQNHIAPGGMVHTANGGNYDYNWAKGLHFAWGDCYGDVNNNGTGEPRVKSGWVEVTHVDYNTQTVSYRFFLDVCSDIDGHNMQSIMGNFQVHEDLIGYLEIEKGSALPDISNNNSNYSLAGARYGIYADESCTDLKQTLVTDENGRARSKALQVGTYYVKELSAPLGYALDLEVHEANVAAGVTRTCSIEDVPQSDRTAVLLIKHDSDRAVDKDHNDIQGGATSFRGAEFTVMFYPTLNKDYSAISPARTWVFAADEHGMIDLTQNDACKVGGDELFYDTSGSVALPIGTYTIQETKAPEGYRLNESVAVRTVEGIENGGETLSGFAVPVVADSIMRGGVQLEKRDAESGLQSSLGAGTLDGSVFTITNSNSHDVQIGGIFFKPGEICYTLIAHEGGAQTAPDALPYGEYTLQEIAAGDGYNASDNAPRSFSIDHDGQIVRFCDTDGEDSGAFKNLVKRGDLNFIKVREENEQRLAGVPFKITSKTTGESHVVLSDENGIVDTSAEWLPHTNNTNHNDTEALDPTAGVWFGTTKEGNFTPPRDDRGALPFDQYTLEELPCAANEGLKLIKTDFSIYREKQQLDFGVVQNRNPLNPWITTTATDSADHDKLLSSDSDVVINDHVRYGNLQPGETYTLMAQLVDSKSGSTIEGATGTTIFEAQENTGSAEVSIPVNLLDATSRDVVVYETLLKDDEVVVEHAEPDNSEQTLSVLSPRIGTEAIDAADGDHEILCDETVQLIDTVSYLYLTAGQEYQLRGELMVKRVTEDGSVEAVPLTDEEGAPIQSTSIFTPQNANGTTEIHFTFDASNLEPGDELVVFEYLSREDVPVAEHCDPEDENQSIQIVEKEQPPTPLETSSFGMPESPLEAARSFFAKTGSATLPFVLGAAFSAIAASGLIGFGLFQHHRAKEVTEAIARNMLGSPPKKQ